MLLTSVLIVLHHRFKTRGSKQFRSLFNSKCVAYLYIFSTSCEINMKSNNKTSFFIWTSLTCKPRPSSLGPLGFHTRARSSAHRDWLRRATKARPLAWRHRGSACGARQRDSRAALTSLVWGEAAQPPWPLISHRYGSEAKPQPGLFERGPPGDADDKRLQLRANQLCRLTSDKAQGRGGGGGGPSRDEKWFSRGQLGQGRSLEPCVCFLSRDNVCSVCARSGESITVTSAPLTLPSLF